MKKDDPGYCESSESVGVTVVTDSADIKITANTEDDVEVDINITSGGKEWRCGNAGTGKCGLTVADGSHLKLVTRITSLVSDPRTQTSCRPSRDQAKL